MFLEQQKEKKRDRTKNLVRASLPKGIFPSDPGSMRIGCGMFQVVRGRQGLCLQRQEELPEGGNEAETTNGAILAQSSSGGGLGSKLQLRKSKPTAHRREY